VKIPLIVRMLGTNEKKAKEILTLNKIHVFESIEECAKKIKNIVK